MANVARSAAVDARSSQLCLGGGVALNCASNGKLLTNGSHSSVWAFAAAGDAGLGVGAGLLAARSEGRLERKPVDNVYFGPAFDDKAIEKALGQESEIAYRRSRDVAEEVAAHLARGQIVGWFQGRMELGPRALGNRSILVLLVPLPSATASTH